MRSSCRCPCALVYLFVTFPCLTRYPLYVLVFRIAFFSAIRKFTGFDADASARNLNFEEASGQGRALDTVAADTDGGSLAEKDGIQRANLFFGAEDGQLVGRAIFLHEDGREPDIPGPGFEEKIHGIAQDFPGAVIDVAFQNPKLTGRCFFDEHGAEGSDFSGSV